MSDKCIVCQQSKVKKNKKFCSYECAWKYKQNYKECAICGRPFKDSVSNPTKNCSNACSKAYRQKLHEQGVYNGSLDKMLTGKKKYWEEHSGEKNINAKHWIIKSPIGEVYEIDNLQHFVRTNLHLFDGATVRQAADGIRKIKASQLGKTKAKLNSWKGWELLSWKEEIGTKS